MHSRVLRWSGLLAIAAYLFVVMTGCAESRAPINRVQPMALSKAFFVGANFSSPTDDPEFYFSSRIIDVPYGTGNFLLMNAWGGLARIKWEIQENLLLARLTYDRIQNSDYYGSVSTDTGQVVAQFAIQSQFDIIRDYNPQTGEQLNVIVENTTDRPWYQREYFRVDWSQNLVTDEFSFDVFALAGGGQGVQIQPVQYYVQDPSDPNAPVFDTDNGYFDVTTMLLASPQMINTPYGTFPACYAFWTGSQALNCDPTQITVRLSFKVVQPDDFEPEDWIGTKMNAVGLFTQNRYGYDRNYGIIDQDWHRFASKYQIWQATHLTGTQCAIDEWRDANGNVQTYQVDGNGNYVTDPTTGLPIAAAGGQPFTMSGVGLNVHRDNDNDGTEDECQFYDANNNEVNPGSRCDEFTNKCDIPLYERQTKTTPMYYGPASPPDVFAASAHALNSWNIAVKRATQLGKQVEANRVGVDVGQANFITSEADLLTDQANGSGMTVPDIFVLCHNPVIQGDAPACGAPGLAARLGDLRYNMVNVIPTPQSPSAWGIMTDFNDPLTGEKVQTSVNVWDAVTDIAAQSVEDLLRWLEGEISNTQIANGTYMSEWVSGSQLSTAQYSPNVLSKSEIQTRLNSIDRSGAKLNGLGSGKLAPPVAATLAAGNLARALGPSFDAQLEGSRTSLMGSQWEAQLMNPDILQQAGYDPQQPFAGDPTTLTTASPLRGLNPRLRQWALQQRNATMIQANACVFGMDPSELPEPDSLIGLARQAETLFPQPNTKDSNYPAELYTRDQAMHQWIREQFHTSVIAHEMGHSMGLRHNFVGSWDALNYHTEYWQIRTRNGQEHYCGYPGPLDALTPHTNGTDCVGPRWVDPVTDAETNDLVWKWGSSTVMDYPGDMTQDMNDIGAYDKAAMRFSYADVVDVETKMKYAVSEGDTGGSGSDYLGAVDGFGGIFGEFVGQNHYATYADKYALLGQCSARPGWNGSPTDALAMQCSGPSLDYVALRDMQTVPKYDTASLSVRPDLVANFAVAPGNHNLSSTPPSASGQSVLNSVRHPYQFGSDEFADFGNLPVFRFDAGADSYEQMQFEVSTYENRYIFDNFRRNRTLFNTDAVVARIQSRYWNLTQSITKALALGIELETQPGYDPTTQPGALMSAALGSADGLAMFVRAMTRPAPGAYVITQAAPSSGTPNTWGGAWQLGDQNLLSTPPSSVNIALGNGEGRYLENNYDYTQGYWWSDYQTQVGSAYEKMLVPMYLTEAYNDFVSNSEDDYVDGRYKNLSYISVYPQQIRRLFANYMATNSATQVNQLGTAAEIFTMAPYAMPGTGTNPLTSTQYLPWDQYDPTNSSTTTLQYPSGAVLLDPLVGWEEQYPGLMALFWFGPTALNMNLVDMMRVFSPGDAASLSIPASAEVIFRDPLTQIEYVAKNYGTEWVNPAIGFQTAQGIAARMIQHANYLAAQSYQLAGSPDPVTGELTYDLDGSGNPILLATPQASTTAAFLKGFVTNIDTARQLTYFFGYGPVGH